MFTDLLLGAERENKALRDALLEAAIKYKTSWEQELYHREQHGVTGPEPMPHPDDIAINLSTCEVEIRGPMTKEDEVNWASKASASSTATTGSPNSGASLSRIRTTVSPRKIPSASGGSDP